MKNILLPVIILVTILNACNKPNVTHYTINAELKAHFNYQVGTYWIYRDSITGNLDSFYVTKNQPSTTSSYDHNGDGWTSEVIDISIYEQSISAVSTDTDYVYFGYTYAETAFMIGYIGKKIKETMLSPLINYPFQTTFTQANYFSGNDYDIATLLSISNTYSFNGNTLSNIALVNHRATSSLIEYNDFFYISDSVGIVKMRLNHPLDSTIKVWEIQRWHIVK